MRINLSQGEKIVSTQSHEGKLLVFTDYGTVFEIKFDHFSGQVLVMLL